MAMTGQCSAKGIKITFEMGSDIANPLTPLSHFPNSNFYFPIILGSFNYLAIDNDWAVNVGADEGSAGGIEITFKRGSGIADPQSPQFTYYFGGHFRPLNPP